MKRKVISQASVILTLLLLLLVAGCKKKTTPAQAPPPPPAKPEVTKPTASLSASPSSIEKGESSTLTWSTSGATNVSIEPGIGDVSTSGNRSVSPSSTTSYTLTAKGEGGITTATAQVSVNAPPPPTPTSAPKVKSIAELFNEEVRDVYFDYDKSDIRDDAKPTLAAAANFLKTNSYIKFSIGGHCDERGSEEYNLGLGDRRANSVKTYLISLGITADRMTAISYGKEQPVCHDSNEECWQKNRRAHFTISEK
ncbi:MAG: peptidoglycan-associated lipoprotein Pal [Terriglobia bacterium]